MGTPYVKGNQVLKDDYNYTIGLRKIALFPYQSRSRFYKGSESSLAEISQPMMEFVVRQTHDTSLIRERNAYLAADMLERAISRKNDRKTTWETRQ